MSGVVTIRPATGADRLALARLAELDSRPPPEGEVLLAFVDGELQAAVAVGDGSAVADPFRPTAELVRLLRLRAAQQVEGGAQERRAGRLRRLAPAWRY